MATIGEAARRAGLSSFQARWYADQGLLGDVRRAGNRRQLTEEQVELLVQIGRWRRATLSLTDIRALRGKSRAGETVSDRVVTLVDELRKRTEALKVLAGATVEAPVPLAADVQHRSRARC
jgi:DNA-binding transcriptional MerR regulator